MAEFTCMLIDDDIEDHELVLTGLRRTVDSIRFVTAFDGSEALTILRSIYRKPDLILLDLNMPIMNGQQFMTEFNHEEALKSIPVVVLTTSSNEDDRAGMMALGVTDFLTKPGSVAEWENMLNKIAAAYIKKKQSSKP